MQDAIMPLLDQSPTATAGHSAATSLTEDLFLGGKVRILQPEKGYRAGLDAVLLAAAVPALPGDSLFEAGVGTGVPALCLAARVANVHVTGVEISARYAMIAEENARRNGHASVLSIVRGDMKDALRRDLVHWPEQNSFVHAFSNPPYFDDDKVQASPNPLKAQAASFGSDDLEIWIKVLAAMVRPRGTVTMIHRADALPRILAAMDGKLGDISVRPVHPREAEPASRVLVQGIRGSRAPMRLMPGLVLHGEGHGFTPRADAILRGGAPLKMR